MISTYVHTTHSVTVQSNYFNARTVGQIYDK